MRYAPIRTTAALIITLSVAGCGGQRSGASAAIQRLVSQARPIGFGPRFQPSVSGHPSEVCRPRLGHRIAAHVEVFARDRVVIIPAGVGLRAAPRRDGRVIAGRCYGSVVTLDPTGVVLVSATTTCRATLSELFAAWGPRLSRTRLAGFRAPPGAAVRVYVNGRQVEGTPGAVTITRHAEIVLEVGPVVPPHSSYTFPPRSPPTGPTSNRGGQLRRGREAAIRVEGVTPR